MYAWFNYSFQCLKNKHVLSIDETGSLTCIDFPRTFPVLLIAFQVPYFQNSLVVAQSLNCLWPFATPWTVACQTSLPFSISQSLLKLMSIESVMPSNHLILCHPLLLLPSVFPSIRIFSNEWALHIRWPKYWNSPLSSALLINIQGLFPLGLTGPIPCCSRDSQKSSPAPQF